MEDSGIDTNDTTQHTEVRQATSKVKRLDYDSDTESEGSDDDWDPREEIKSRKKVFSKKVKATTTGAQSDNLMSSQIQDASHQQGQSLLTEQVFTSISQQTGPASKPSGLAREVRHNHSVDVQPGVPGQHESTSLLVDVPINEQSDGSDDEIPMSWQRSNRSMREQLLKDGYNLDLESDNDDLDLIPPKQNYGVGGICSCSGDSCSIS